MREETAEGMTSKLEAEHIFQQLNKAIIISIGNEILIGKILNTNAHWLSGELTRLGFLVDSCLTVQDNVTDIGSAFRYAWRRRARVVISTGGLGPTFDDKTVEGLARAFSLPLNINPEALKFIREKYESRGMTITPERLKMAYMPVGAIPLENPAGTAPGIYLKHYGTHFFILPGPPKEVEAIFNAHVRPLIESIFKRVEFLEASITIRGIPESEFAPVVREAMEKFKNVYVKSHPKGFELGSPVLEIHITTFDKGNSPILKECFQFIIGRAEKLGGEITISKGPV